jgi:type IV pilus assembly protein PilW
MRCQTRGVRSRRRAGFSLVELMVALAISLVVSLAIFSVLNTSEGRKRTSNAVNDVNQVGSYASYVVDRSIRSAGSGFSANWGEAFGCAITAARANQPVLPSAAAFPAPFAGVPQALRLAPVIIVRGGAADDDSDALVVMAGMAGFGEAGSRLLASISDNEARVRNSVGFRGGDMVLINDPSSGQCLVSQIDAAFTTDGTEREIPLAGAYLTQALNSDADINNFAAGSFLLGLGNPNTNPPQFQAIGVGDNQTLVSLDLLRINGNAAPVPMAENVVLMRAFYGVDTNGDKQVDSWVEPTGNVWGATALMSGSAASQANLRNILAIRLAMVMRSSLVEKEDFWSGELDVFKGQDQEFKLDNLDKRHRYRVFETTVPVRNNLMP